MNRLLGLRINFSVPFNHKMVAKVFEKISMFRQEGQADAEIKNSIVIITKFEGKFSMQFEEYNFVFCPCAVGTSYALVQNNVVLFRLSVIFDVPRSYGHLKLARLWMPHNRLFAEYQVYNLCTHKKNAMHKHITVYWLFLAVRFRFCLSIFIFSLSRNNRRNLWMRKSNGFCGCQMFTLDIYNSLYTLRYPKWNWSTLACVSFCVRTKEEIKFVRKTQTPLRSRHSLILIVGNAAPALPTA